MLRTVARYVYIVALHSDSSANDAVKQHNTFSDTGNGHTIPCLSQNLRKRWVSELYVHWVETAKPA